MRILPYAWLLAWIWCIPQQLNAQSDTARFHSDLVYVKLMDTAVDLDTATIGMSGLRDMCHRYKVKDYHKPCKGFSAKLDHIYVFQVGEGRSCDSFVNELKAIPYIEYAERAPMFHIFYTPNDFSPTAQYALQLIQAPLAWDFTKGSKNVVIAVVDNAERTTHEDIAPNLWVNKKEIPNNGVDDDLDGYVDDFNGFDVADNDNVPNVPIGIADTSAWIHGSHTSGIAGASTDNGKGIASVGFNVSIMAVKCTPDKENGKSLPNALDGIVYAMRAGADIISMSFGTDENSQTIKLLMDQAHQLGIVLVAAAGNENTEKLSYPAAYEPVIAVAATDQNDRRASFSNFGSWVDVSAPGVGIKSALGGTNSSYGTLSGTSMATPMVAGLAGLVLSVYPNATPDQVKDYIQKGCANINSQNPSYVGKLGAGRINAARTFNISAIEAQQHSEQAIAIYPNPLRQNEEIHIALNAGVNVQQAKVDVFDLQGRLILSTQLSQGSEGFYTLEGLNLPQGSYWLRLTDEHQSCTKPLVVIP